jgi:hypothetical protein
MTLLCLSARARRSATRYFFTAAFQFVTIVSGGDDGASEAFVVLMRNACRPQLRHIEACFDSRLSVAR